MRMETSPTALGRNDDVSNDAERIPYVDATLPSLRALSLPVLAPVSPPNRSCHRAHTPAPFFAALKP
jgi:hypothetical protein